MTGVWLYLLGIGVAILAVYKLLPDDVSSHSRHGRRLAPQPTDRGRAD